jgi:phosphoribosylformylglycinamidine synthase subunit PurSL
VALAESALAGRVGIDVALDNMPWARGAAVDPARLLFCETPSRFIVSVKRDKDEAFRKAMKGLPCAELGKTTGSGQVIIRYAGKPLVSAGLEKIMERFKGQFD